MTAGILGNLYDRLGLPGLVWPRDHGPPAGAPVHAVRDFILVMIGPWPWPNFNLADSSLVCGAGLLFCHAFLWVEKAERRRSTRGKLRRNVWILPLLGKCEPFGLCEPPLKFPIGIVIHHDSRHAGIILLRIEGS